jgi:N-methylhydantoinase A
MTVSQFKPSQAIRIGIDIGGTFTDFVIFHPETKKLQTFKILSTPDDPSTALLEGLKLIGITAETQQSINIIHGSTVATNALLERSGARTALITTRGFKDVIQIGRQNRPFLYDLSGKMPKPLIPEEYRYEVTERVDYQGEILQPLDSQEIDQLVPILHHEEIASISICLLFSFLHPQHEAIIADRLRKEGFFVSVSSELIPEYREYERMSTTTVNAYISPVLDKYFSHLEDSLSKNTHLRIMQSNGGIIGVSEARRFGVHCILSGPAGGVTGAHYVSKMAFHAGNGYYPSLTDQNKIITLDMGGTSTDVSLINQEPLVTTEGSIDGYPILIPILDIHSIGAGGGSIATVDTGGALVVGPRSAGASPGPACYGIQRPNKDGSLLATVTDANLILGRLSPEFFLGGKMILDFGMAEQAITNIGNILGLDACETAMGIIQVTNAHMERALRLISVERGYDPRDFVLLSYGGAGGLHAASLARRLNIPIVIIPPTASVLSALGMLCANVIKDYTKTVLLSGDVSKEALAERFEPLLAQGSHDLMIENISEENSTLYTYLDMRFQGQSYELTIPWNLSNLDFQEMFLKAYRTAYGSNPPDSETEIVNLRVKAVGLVTPVPLIQYPKISVPSQAIPLFTKPVYIMHNSSLVDIDLPFYQGENLLPGQMISGPCIILRTDTTILLGPGDEAYVDSFLNLIINIDSKSEF